MKWRSFNKYCTEPGTHCSNAISPLSLSHEVLWDDGYAGDEDAPETDADDNALAQDDPSNDYAKPYVNLFVSQDEDKDNETYKKVVELFHSSEVQEVVQEETAGTAVEVETDVSELRSTLADAEESLRK